MSMPLVKTMQFFLRENSHFLWGVCTLMTNIQHHPNYFIVLRINYSEYWGTYCFSKGLLLKALRKLEITHRSDIIHSHNLLISSEFVYGKGQTRVSEQKKKVGTLEVTWASVTWGTDSLSCVPRTSPESTLKTGA